MEAGSAPGLADVALSVASNEARVDVLVHVPRGEPQVKKLLRIALCLTVFALGIAAPSAAQPHGVATSSAARLTLEDLARQPTISHPLFRRERVGRSGLSRWCPRLILVRWPGFLCRLAISLCAPLASSATRSAVVWNEKHRRTFNALFGSGKRTSPADP